MPELIKLNIQDLLDKILPVLKSYPQIEAAYLFGSALDRVRPDSDIDIALLLSPDIDVEDLESWTLAEEIGLHLTRLVWRSFDISLLNTKDYLFAMNVLTSGKLIYVKNNDLLGDFIEKVSLRHRMWYNYYKRALLEVVENDRK
ncbi:type VII toxin-antitoxin system MntA family adenylyltransferase antitoxin [Carboxydothermus pertinax]|uniref:Nucleotidyltransferase domain protein n=1 Tax=Carboxydothermus pertinax TaxID=870242 RepID=A0A1L8CVX8_9THEO|nr:nucleotidyltransferase domain-containing protein [Carboxydothermus pertinax]GAV23047.1 nucleotidyltransferase domain protein [Carboxydothermus pertinax]